MYRFIILLILPLFAVTGHTQQYQPYYAPYSQPQKKIKKAIINVQAFDGVNYRADLISVGYDYLLVDAKNYNSPAKLRPYYIRPEGDYQRIDIEYIKTATMTRGRSIGVSTLRGTILGIFVAGLISVAALKEEIVFESFGDWAITTGVIVGIGTSAGFITGLFRRKKFEINGNPGQLNKLSEYYNP